MKGEEMRTTHKSLALIIGSLLCSAGAAHADITQASSSGYGLAADVSLLVANLEVLPQGHATGTAPGPYSQSESTLNASFTTAGLANISAGVLSGEAYSDVDGLAGTRTATGMGRVTDLGTDLVLGTILDLNAGVIESEAAVSGDYGSLLATGSSILTDVDLSVLGAEVLIDANAAPNTVLFDALGIRIVLNEQIVGGNGIDDRTMEVNAIRISFDNVAAGLGLLNGDIRIAHSYAEMGAVVPAPASFMLLASGGLLTSRRRR